MSNQPFIHRFRVRYSEVDPQGIVFNSRHLEYADMLLTEFWRALGMAFSGVHAIELHVVKATVEYLRPIGLDEVIEGRARVARIGTSSVTTRFELHGDAEGAIDDLRARIELVHVHVDLATGRSMPLSEDARARLLAPLPLRAPLA